MEIFKNMPDIANLRIAYLDLGFNRNYAKKYGQAVDFFQKAVELSRETGYDIGLCQANSGLANSYTQLNELDLAMEHANQAYQLAKQIEDPSELGFSALALGDVWLAREEPEQASHFYEESIPLLEETKQKEGLKLAQHGLKESLSQIGSK
jgi:tetratricopeptide (TPR) repeat protein